MTNDNFFGYPTDIIYKYKVRWIECAAACPFFTSLINYYVEGDKGHLLNEKMHRGRHPVAVRGNVYSFHMPWEEIMCKMAEATGIPDLDKALSKTFENLPHPPEALAQMVLFSVNIGDVAELDEWLPVARLRPHVVLKLMFFLVDSHFGHGSNLHAGLKMKATLEKQLRERYPETEAHLQEEERQGVIPPAIEEAIRRNMKQMRKDKEPQSGIFQKHATPAGASGSPNVLFEELRPDSLFADRRSEDIVKAGVPKTLALGKHYKMKVNTNNTFVDQWNSAYVSKAFPFSIPRPVSGADFPNRPANRRKGDAPHVSPWVFSKALAARVEECVRNDWILVPANRNLTVKWDALCGNEVACKHNVDKNKAGNVHAAELSDAAGKLYHKLANGHWWDGKKRRKINHDFSKLKYATDLSDLEKKLVRDLSFLSQKFADTQEVRLLMNHALFGARIEYGDPLFLTVSPSASHSGLCIRLSRYRYEDPAVRCNLDDKTNFCPWAGSDKPNLWVNESEDAVIMDIPEYEVRRTAVSRDPWCVVLAFLHSAKFVLPAGLGIQMCPQCPHCNHDGSVRPCQTIYGHNMRPTGGAAGLGVTSGGTIEYQQCNNPHVHKNVHIASVYQHHTLVEIGEKLRQNLLELDTIKKYVSWIHREEHYHPESHDEKLAYWEKEWKSGHRSSDHSVLCQLPSFYKEAPGSTLWSPQPASRQEAIAEGAGFLKNYTNDVQKVFSRCHHHWHPRDLKTGVRRPIWGCLSTKKQASVQGQVPQKTQPGPKGHMPWKLSQVGLARVGPQKCIGPGCWQTH